jgi:hypothetical protein
VLSALRGAGPDPFEQGGPEAGGANVIATLPGDVDRWMLVGAHFDHLGKAGGQVFWGADDNAAAAAILVELARGLAHRRPAGRGMILAAFDAEEPPNFLTGSMGSEHFARAPAVPVDRIDLIVCMDLVGHAFGGEGLPADVRGSLFALGAERSAGTAFEDERRDALTLRSLIDLLSSLALVSEEAEQGMAYAEALLACCDREGRLPPEREGEVGMLVETLEARLS